MHIPGIDQWFVIALLCLLLFGKRLPEVGRSIGKGISGFKNGLEAVEDGRTQRNLTDFEEYFQNSAAVLTRQIQFREDRNLFREALLEIKRKFLKAIAALKKCLLKMCKWVGKKVFGSRNAPRVLS